MSIASTGDLRGGIGEMAGTAIVSAVLTIPTGQIKLDNV